MIGRARLPSATETWDYPWINQLLRALDQNFDRSFLGWPNYAEASGYYGSFISNQTQTVPAPNAPYPMTFNITLESEQIAMQDGSKITFKNRGAYNIQFSAQVDQSAGSNHSIYIWIRKNGVDVENSAGRITIQGQQSEVVPSWNYIVNVLGGDYIQMMWAVSDTAVALVAEPATAFCPAVPSVIISATSV